MKLYRELAEYYFAIESNHRDIRDDIALILSVLGQLNNPSILDLGCGTGEHLNELSRRGCRCTGIDASADMLNVARERFPDAGRFIQSDMSDIDFFEEFNLAYSLFGTINYMTDDARLERMMWNTWRALKPGGTAILEVWNSFPIEKIRNREISPVSTTLAGGVKIERHRGFTLIEEGPRTVVEVNYRYVVTRDGQKREILDRHVMRAFSRAEIEGYLGENGFTIRKIYASSRRDEYCETSNKMMIVVEKP
jgi:SAM-dependent methyltransferase